MRVAKTRVKETAHMALMGNTLRTAVMPKWQSHPLCIRLFKG
jgi:hypothetical protein